MRKISRCIILPDSMRSSSVFTRSNRESRRETRYLKGEHRSQKEAFVSFIEEKNFRRSSADELEAKATKTMAKNSAFSSKWGLTNFNQWFEDYNERNPNCKCPKVKTAIQKLTMHLFYFLCNIILY